MESFNLSANWSSITKTILLSSIKSILHGAPKKNTTKKHATLLMIFKYDTHSFQFQTEGINTELTPVSPPGHQGSL